MATNTLKRRSRPVRLADLPPGRRIACIALLVLLPLAILAAAEGALRLAGFGGYPGAFRTVGTLPDGSRLVFTTNDGPATFFFSSRSQGLSLDPAAFRMPKPEGVVRVMWVGASAAKGIPQPRHLRASAFFSSMLDDATPDAQVEVINIGVPGVGAFPVLSILTEALRYDPDLVVAYTGNNEFYGAYGVSSLHTAGRTPLAIRITRAVRATALAQAIDHLLRGRVTVEPDSLMEAMVGQACIGPDDPTRRAVARNLELFVGQMIDRCKARGVPIVVCAPVANESGMAPLGEPDLSDLSPQDLGIVRSTLSTADQLIEQDPIKAETALRSLLEIVPDHARVHHLLGRALRAQGRNESAAAHFRKAVDLDPMPWRPPQASVEAIRRAAASRGAVLADLPAAFRAASPDGAVGWDLVDDHVHPSLRGQALVARTVLRALADLDHPIAPDASLVHALPPWQEYARRHGANVYDEYAVAHAMRVFGTFELFAGTNPEMTLRNHQRCLEIEAVEHPLIAGRLRAWAAGEIGGDMPVTAVVADALSEMGRPDLAEPLLRAAAAASTPYGSRQIGFTCFALQCVRAQAKPLSEANLAAARNAVQEGEFLIAIGQSRSGQAERFVGQLHLLLDQPARALPFLTTAHDRLSGSHRVAADEALVAALLQTGRTQEAEAIVREGLAGPDARAYLRLAERLP